MKKSIYFLTAILFIFSVVTSTKAQINETTGDSLSIKTPPSKHALYSGVGYGSNLLFSGLSLSENQPYLSMDLLYIYNKNWMASMVLYNLPGVDPALAFYDLMIGYTKTFNTYFDAGISLSRYSTAKRLQDEYFEGFSYLTISGGLDWRILYTQAVFSTMLSNDGTSYIQINNSHFFSTPDIFKSKAYFTFDPSINMVLGEKYQINETITQTGTGENNSTAETQTTYSTSFGLLDMEFSLPISLNFGKTTIEMEPLYYLPIHNDPDFPAKKDLFLFLNLYFKLL